MDRAYSVFEIKAADAERRVIEGIASTPSPDRDGDVMEPKGAEFTLPMPLLWQHNQREPIGEVFDAKVTEDGIFIKARLAKVDTPGRVKDRLDEAWQSITATPPLVRGLSIGWKPIKWEAIKGTSFVRHLRWIWGELSAVTIPANAEASITAVKAASGQSISSGASDTHPVVRATKGASPMTTQEQITSFEAKRAADVARMNAIMTAADGATLDETQNEEYVTLEREVESIDGHLPRLKKLEQFNAKAATAITSTTKTEEASAMRAGAAPVVLVTSMLPKGTAFVRFCMAVASSKGDSYQAMARAKAWKDTPEVLQMMEHHLNGKAAVAVGVTTDSTWAGPLVVTQPLNEFLEMLRPKTLLGRIPGLRQVPFNISMPSQTTGGTYGWVGQNKPKPATKADFATVTVGFAKASGIIVMTEELVKLSTPSAEATVRDEMINGMAAFLDTQFVDPAVAAVAGVNPASITNGASTAAASGATAAAAKADLAASVQVFTAAGVPLEGSVWLMNDSNAFGLSQSLNALGQPLFPGVSITGGSIYGIPVVVSNNVSNRVVLVHAPSILYADDGGVSIDVSREASVQMDTAPTDPTDATTVLISLWQRNLVGLRADRFISWTRARSAAVRYISAAAYTGA